jgi:outer membrane protein assembly factor BamB
MYQHDAAHHAAGTCSGISSSTVSLLHPAWFVQTPAAVTASPTIATVGGVQQVYEGDNGGTFYDIDAATGKVLHTFAVKNNASQETPSRCAHGATSLTDGHQTSYGAFTSSAAVTTLRQGHNPPRTLVYVGANGSLLALDAKTLTCAWAVDLDPVRPTSAMESESSPVVFKRSDGVTEVIVGSDSNEGPGSSAPTGLQAFNAATGEFLWKYEPENNQTDRTLANHSETNGCGDVWSSPAIDPNGLRNGHGLIVATTGNCPNGSAKPGAAAAPTAGCDFQPAPPQIEGMAGIDATSGCLVWRWSEPSNQYANPVFSDGGDTDIGASPILTSVGKRAAVIDGGKSGYMYALDEATGKTIWAKQIAEPGEVGAFGGGIGGFIGSSALGQSSAQDSLTGAPARPTVFGTTAILAPFENTTSGISPDSTLANDPTRAASLHAIDVATGAETWQAIISVPSYAATTYVNGVVFAPSTIGFDIVAYDANTGFPVWAFPLGASPSSGTTIAGSSIFLGAGTTEDPLPPNTPPQVNGIWSFTTNPSVPSISPKAAAVP